MQLSEISDCLEKSGAFDYLEPEHLEQLAEQGDLKVIQEDTEIFTRGELSDSRFLLIVSGTAHVLFPSGELQSQHGEGEIVGEVGLVNKSHKRMRTVVAGDSMTVVEWNLSRIESEAPGLYQALNPILEDIAWSRVDPKLRKLFES